MNWALMIIASSVVNPGHSPMAFVMLVREKEVKMDKLKQDIQNWILDYEKKESHDQNDAVVLKDEAYTLFKEFMRSYERIPFGQMYNVIDYVFADEQHHYEEAEPESQSNHIFNDIKIVSKWITDEKG